MKVTDIGKPSRIELLVVASESIAVGFPVNQGKKCAAEDKEEIAPCKEEQCQACLCLHVKTMRTSTERRSLHGETLAPRHATHHELQEKGSACGLFDATLRGGFPSPCAPVICKVEPFVWGVRATNNLR
eukprot:982132-Amphidinium_carterae.1